MTPAPSATTSLRVLHVASEVAPWAQTGGLADVAAALPPACTAVTPGLRSATVTPLYRATRARLASAGASLGPALARTVTIGVHRFDVTVAPIETGSAAAGGGGHTVWLVDCPPLYDREGLYADGGVDHPDNHVRFAVLCRAALDVAPAILGGAPDVIHGHDWQGGMAPVLARLDGATAATVLTVHNLAYRGMFDKHVVPELGLPWSVFDLHHMEFWDHLSMLKGGMAYADVVTTVSPTYAREMLTPERGEGLDGFLHHDVARVVGIVNGIDVAAWDPATDPALPARYDRTALAGKARCRAAVLGELGLTVDERTPLAVAVARLTPQKGLDLVADLVPELAALGVALVVLGTGERGLEERLRGLAALHPDRVAVRIGFDVGLSRRLYAAADLFLMPSRFEPCGLGQLYAMRYGAVPVVAAVGGLRDTVHDPGDEALAAGRGTGFRFEYVDAPGLRWALGRAARMFRDDPAAFAAVRQAGMARDSSWDASAREYVQVYRAALRDR
jgi:starch synthase